VLRGRPATEPPTIHAKLLEQAPTEKLKEFLRNPPSGSRSVMEDVSTCLSMLHRVRASCQAHAEALEVMAGKAEQGLEASHKEASTRSDSVEQNGEGLSSIDRALLLTDISANIVQQTNAQTKIVDVLALDTPSEHMSSYVLVWDLQPHVSDESMALLTHHSTAERQLEP